MNRGLKIIILIAAGILVIVVIVALLPRGRRPEGSEKSTTSNSTGQVQPGDSKTGTPTAAEPAPPPPPLTEAARTEASLEQQAGIFAERYGSYSTQNPYANYRDLYPLVTARFRAQLEAQSRTAPATTEYLGVTTVALRKKIIVQSESAATVEAATQRVTTNNAGSSNTNYETLTLTFIREAGTWKVDGAAWKKS